MKETMIGHSVNLNTKKLDWFYTGGYITSAVTAYTALLHSFFSPSLLSRSIISHLQM